MALRELKDELRRRYEEWEQDDMPPEVTNKLLRDLALAAGVRAVPETQERKETGYCAVCGHYVMQCRCDVFTPSYEFPAVPVQDAPPGYVDVCIPSENACICSRGTYGCGTAHKIEPFTMHMGNKMAEERLQRYLESVRKLELLARGESPVIPEPEVAVQDALTTPKDGKHFIPLTGKPPCPTCGQPEGIQLTVGATGFSCGTGFEHKPDCAANFCPHGIRWMGDCPLCDAEHYDEEGG